jgi:UDP-N-acetylmuramoylalanine--D-glutamate ligase
MTAVENKQCWIVGLGLSGQAAANLLLARGARVIGFDDGDPLVLKPTLQHLIADGLEAHFRSTAAPASHCDFVVTSPGIDPSHPILAAARARKIPIIGELELGFRHSLALSIAITGTNGKTTTTELVERVLNNNHLRTLAAGNIGTPLCSVIEQTRELDFVTLEVSSFQLETIEFFRPAIALLLNITPDHLDRYPGMEEYVRAKARVFENQQAFDWAVVQYEAFHQLKALGISFNSKTITFSATDQRADIYLDRTLIISRLSDWAGPLLNMEDVQLRGPHNAENIMAALAVGRILRIPLEQVAQTIRAYQPAPHRCEFIAEIGGVKFFNDSKATNVDAVAKALLTMPRQNSTRPNVWLLAGGKDKGFGFHDAGPLLAQRVKGAFLFGETREKIRAAWSLFTPCTAVSTLLEAFSEAVKRAEPGDVILLSPACSSFDQFRNYQHRGDVFRQAVRALASPAANVAAASGAGQQTVNNFVKNLPRGFMENPEANVL